MKNFDSSKKHRAELLLLVGLIVIGLLPVLYLLLTMKPGAVVRVQVDGVTALELPLSVDTEQVIQGYDGGTNLLVISDGSVTVTEASCPDGLCLHMGPIRSAGQSIVCLPNRVVVEIVSADSDLDTVSG